jgi:hypothetical protein
MSKNRITHDDIARMPPHIQAQIASKMAEQNSSLPAPRRAKGHGAHGPAFKVQLTKVHYISFGAYCSLLVGIAIMLMATFPTH